MKKIDIFKILKILCIVLCAIFFLSACSSDSKLCSDETETQASATDAAKNCWQRDLLELIYGNIGNMALRSYHQITSQPTTLLSIMVLAFTIWMAFQILGHVSSTSPVSIGEFWTKILRKAALCFVCGVLASSSGGLIYTINTFILPIYITLLEFASRILDITKSASSATAIYIDGFQICETYHHVKNGACTIAANNVYFDDSHFPQEPLELMGCMACSVADRLNTGYTIAMKMICLEGFIGFLVAILLIAGFTIAKLCFALYLVDSIFRMDVMLIILPFLIMFYPFEQTRKWTAVGFKYILNSAAIMLCLVLIISLTIVAMEKILIAPQIGIKYGKDSFSDFGPSPLAIIFLAFLIIKASGMAVELANSVTGGGGNTNFEKKIKAVVGTIAKMAFSLITLGGGKVVTTVIEKLERIKEMIDKGKKSKNKQQGGGQK